MNIIEKLKRKTISDFLYESVHKVDSCLAKKRKFTDKFTFVNKSNGAENLLLVIAGFQPYYWDAVFERVKDNQANFSEDIDVCICIPEGITNAKEQLRSICEKNNWSYLYLKRDMLSQVQNVAIRLHAKAKWIFKIDEDILLSHNYFKKLKDRYMEVNSNADYPVGMMCPLININACCFIKFLESLNKRHEFETRFGKIRVDLRNPHDIIHRSSDAAKFLWECSVPFDEVAKTIEHQNKGKFFMSPVRFSIGAILFTRKYWETIGGFNVGVYGAMGVEEEQVCGNNVNFYEPTYVAEDIFVGHLGYYSQKEICKQFFLDNQTFIRLKE